MFLIVGDQIVQRKSVVSSNKVDARRRLPIVVFVQIRTAGEAQGELRQHAVCTAPVIAYTVAVLAIPLEPTRRKISHLITAFTYVPRFGYQFYLRDDRVLVDDIKKSTQLIDRVKFPGQRSSQIKTKPVNVHLGYPIA